MTVSLMKENLLIVNSTTLIIVFLKSVMRLKKLLGVKFIFFLNKCRVFYMLFKDIALQVYIHMTWRIFLLSWDMQEWLQFSFNIYSFIQDSYIDFRMHYGNLVEFMESLFNIARFIYLCFTKTPVGVRQHIRAGITYWGWYYILRQVFGQEL